MSLPPELINRILKHLSDDSESLKSMSLVSKTWASWCQAHLFKFVHLTPPILREWLKDVSLEVGGPASHTRVLTLEEYRLTPWINPHFLDFPLSTLAAFSDVRSLLLIQWNATLFRGMSPEPYFGHFGKSLRTLSLRFCTLDPAVFFAFLSLLPKVEDLEIAQLHPPPVTPDTIPDAPGVTPSFCGTLSLADLSSGQIILKTLATLPLHFSTIRIQGCVFYEPEPYQMLVTSCRDTLVTLRFEESYRDRPVPDVSLTSCGELREVHILLLNFMKPPRSLENLLSSITSRKLEKISLTFMDFVDDSDQDFSEDEDEENEWSGGTTSWDSLDITLSRLAQQVHDVGNKLTLQLNVRCVSPQPFKPDRILPKFLGYGSLIDSNRGASTFRGSFSSLHERSEK